MPEGTSLEGTGPGGTSPAAGLSDEQVRKVARLARLALPEERLPAMRAELSAVLVYVERLREVDLSGVEPMAHVGEGANRLDDDIPGAPLPVETVMRLAPDAVPPFIRVPRVLGDGGGA